MCLHSGGLIFGGIFGKLIFVFVGVGGGGGGGGGGGVLFHELKKKNLKYRHIHVPLHRNNACVCRDANLNKFGKTGERQFCVKLPLLNTQNRVKNRALPIRLQKLFQNLLLNFVKIRVF